MRKSTVFISAVLTTFALAILYGVVSAYQSMSIPPKVTPPATNTATPEPTIEPTATLAMITPEQAAQLAAQVVGKTNLLSAESSTYNGVNAYLITFTNRDVVYVGLDGQILGVQVAPVVMNVSAPAPVKHKNTGNNNDNNSGESHEDHEEHEEHDEHDD